VSCRSCGSVVDDAARFCPSCGAPQTVAEEERRIVTVLFADIVGFTSMAEHRDPEEVKHLVDRSFERLTADITDFGGVVDKILGDAIVALFGAPVAHEDDAERAVRAALKMQTTLEDLSRGLTPLEMRVGVNTGEVLVGTSQAGGDYTAMGDVMNSASRLQELAKPCQVLVGDTTYQATASVIHYKSVGDLDARGREDPLTAWIALEAIGAPGAHRRGSDRFVGRRHELSLLEAQAQLAFEKQRTQLGTVLGEAGIGKTRLARELVERVASTYDATILEGRCLPYGEVNVWWPIAEVLRTLLDLPVDAKQLDAESEIELALSVRLETTNKADLARYTQGLMHALGYTTPLRGGDRMRNRSEVMLAFTTVLHSELRFRPVVLILSDMHWAAEAVWALLGHTLHEFGRSRLFLLMTARELDAGRIFDGQHGSALVHLGPLVDQSARLLLEQLAPDLPEQTVDQLVAQSGGNPFFLEELVDLLKDEAARIDIEEPPIEAEWSQLSSLPTTLRGIISARLDSLGVGERSLLEDAAVLGRNSTIEGLAILAKESRGVDDIHEDLTNLVRKDLLITQGHRYEFGSDLVRDVAYGTLTKTSRAARHTGIAKYLEQRSQGSELRNSAVVAIADHYRSAAQLSASLSAIPTTDSAKVLDKAIHWVETAASRALDVGEPAAAETWYDSGVKLATDDVVLARFLYGRAKARCEIHDIVGSRSDLERLEPMAGLDPVLAAQALLVSGDIDRKAGDVDRAAGRLREASDKLAALGQTSQQALALRLLGINEMERGDDSLAQQALESSRAVAAAANDRRAEAWALQSLAWHAFSRGRIQDANRLVSQAIEIFVEIGDRGGLVWAQAVQAWVAFHSGQWEVASELVDSIMPEVKRRGDPWAEAIMLQLASSLALWSGQATNAISLAKSAANRAAQAESTTLVVQAKSVEGRALVSRGRVAEGTATLEEAFALADQSDDQAARRFAVIANCASSVRLGDPERAIRWAARFENIHEDLTVLGETDLVVSLSLAMLQRGSADEAASQLFWDTDDQGGNLDGYGEAVAAILAAVQGRSEAVEAHVSRVLGDGSTYLDQVLALMARAATAYRQGDDDAIHRAFEAAYVRVNRTDDKTTLRIVDLACALFGNGSVESATQQMSANGIDPTAWLTVWRLASISPGQNVE